jgi:hypothetical protein
MPVTQSLCYHVRMEDSIHFLDMLREREIRREWVEAAELDPDEVQQREDGTTHYIKCFAECGNRWLRVIVNTANSRPRRITAFFDRGDQEKTCG